MNSYTFMGLDDVEEGEEISSRKKTFIKRAIAYIKTRRHATQVSRNSITIDRAGAHERLVAAYFTDSSMYNKKCFRQTFRMARPLFNQIVNAVTTHSAYFQSNPDCAGREGISPLIKCTSSIRQLAYGVNASFLDEYMQISERSSRMALDHFCQAVMEIYGPEFLRKPMVTDVEKLYRHHEEKHGWVEQRYQRSPIFNDLKTGRAPEIPFVANGVTYPYGYYLVEGIYPELAPLVKTIPEPADDDHKRILFKQKQESARKDVERAFGFLKKKWAILTNLARALKKDRIINSCLLFALLLLVVSYALAVETSPQETTTQGTKGDTNKVEPNYGGGGGSNWGGGGGGQGGGSYGCRHGCCYGGRGGCQKCCSSLQEAQEFAEFAVKQLRS
ncbi:serine/threonine-protein kinase STY17-like protein [Tanacetum coccineum]